MTLTYELMGIETFLGEIMGTNFLPFKSYDRNCTRVMGAWL